MELLQSIALVNCRSTGEGLFFTGDRAHVGDCMIKISILLNFGGLYNRPDLNTANLRK